MPYPVPPKHYRVLASLLKHSRKGNSQVAWKDFVNVFNHWGFNVVNKSGNWHKFIPPCNRIIWPFRDASFIAYKPQRQLSPEDVRGLRNQLERIYGWNSETFVPRGAGRPGD